MKLYTADMRLAEVIRRDHLLLPVISRLGVPPGFGEHTIGAVCGLHNIESAFFLALLNAFSFAMYGPARRLRREAILPLVNYLEHAHAYYREAIIPRIESLLDELIREGSPTDSQRSVLLRFFHDYKSELLAHLHREDTITFPYVRMLCADSEERRHGIRTQRPVRGTYSMHEYAAEHNDVDSRLDDLKNIILCHMHTTAPPALVNDLVDALYRFERDIHDHTRIEDHILRPLVRRVERALRVPSRVPAYADREASTAPAQFQTLRPPTLPDAPGPGVDASVLTSRERDVLHLVARGFLNKQIADELRISMHTVISHRKHMTAKLHIRTVAGLTMYAFLAGIITSEHMQ